MHASGRARLGAHRHQHNLPAALFALESRRTDITMRLLAAEARIALHHMRSGSMTDDDWGRLARRMPDVSAAPLCLLIAVDDLHLFNYGTRPLGSRYEEVSKISCCLKLLAKELEIPIIAGSTLTRGPEQRTTTVPILSDLRGSGALENNADLVTLIHREEMYEKDSPRAGEADRRQTPLRGPRDPHRRPPRALRALRRHGRHLDDSKG
ncbi:hypothetical protein GCM10010353_63930 [Streptomyces chryseus]|nr:hypothetical protein GCM10010353_63930 [Streptomyces chryseus]